LSILIKYLGEPAPTKIMIQFRIKRKRYKDLRGKRGFCRGSAPCLPLYRQSTGGFRYRGNHRGIAPTEISGQPQGIAPTENETAMPSPLSSAFGFEIDNGLSPDRNLNVVLVKKTNTMGILPENFTHQQIIVDEFELYLLFIFDVGLNFANAGQSSLEFRHNCT
jgi:hypothetical protein